MLSACNYFWLKQNNQAVNYVCEIVLWDSSNNIVKEIFHKLSDNQNIVNVKFKNPARSLAV